MQTNASTRDYTRYTITKDDRIRFLGRQWCLKKNNSEWDPDEALKWMRESSSRQSMTNYHVRRRR